MIAAKLCRVTTFNYLTSTFCYFQGWYIITYALGIYHLNLFIAFLTPKMDPSLPDFDGKYGTSHFLEGEQ